MIKKFTEKELEELRKFDAEIDAMEMTYDDYLSEDFVEDLLFPEKASKRKREAARRKEKIEEKKKDGTYSELKKKYKEDYQKNKEKDRIRKKEWYKKNKERIMLQQKDYRIRTGRQKDKSVEM